MTLKVFLNMYGKRQEVGLLAQEKQRIFFEYAPDFLKNGIELSPFKLPLKPGVFEEKSRIFDGLFGLFNDSLPDGWGCLLLDRKLRKMGKSYAEITPLDRLSLIGANPMGALEYEPSTHDTDLCRDIELDSLSYEVDRIIEGEESSVLDELLKLNGSSGGARPKIVAYVSPDRKHIIHGGKNIPDSYTPWLIKFSEKQDLENSGEQEYRYSQAAKAAGIAMPETHLFPLQNGRHCFGVRRFDRTEKGKVHTHTACGLLHASHRFASLDYENLLKLTWLLTKDHTAVKEMVRRMIFNVKSGNKDDHSKNFSFLLTPENEWQLSPAYDLTHSSGINGEQTCMVNGKDNNISDADLMKTAATANVSEAETKDTIKQVNSALLQYKILR